MPNQNDKRRDNEKVGQDSSNQDEQRFGQQQQGGQSPSRHAGNQNEDGDMKNPGKNAGGDESSSGGVWSDRDESREASTDTSRGSKGP
jgi:hypothetical protein